MHTHYLWVGQSLSLDDTSLASISWGLGHSQDLMSVSVHEGMRATPRDIPGPRELDF